MKQSVRKLATFRIPMHIRREEGRGREAVRQKERQRDGVR